MIEKYQEILHKIKKFRKNFFKLKTFNCREKLNIVDIIDIENGYQPPKNFHIYEYEKGYVRFIQNRDYNTNNHITYIPISSKNHLCNEYDIMMDKYGEAGKIRYGLNGGYNVALLKIKPKKYYNEFIRDFFTQSKIEKYLFNSSQASTRSSLNQSSFNALKIPLLQNEELKKFEKTVKNFLYLEIKINAKLERFKYVKNILLNKYF